MKQSTLKVRSRAFKVTPAVAERIRAGKCVIMPLLSKEVLAKGDYLYLKEPLEDYTYTTKNTAKTFIRVISNKIFNVQEITDEDIQRIDCDIDFIDYYNTIIEDMSRDISSSVSSKKLINEYSYSANPNVQLTEFELLSSN